MADKCIQKGFSEEGQMNVLTGEEIKPLLVFNEAFRSSSFAIILVLKGSFVIQKDFVKNTLAANELHLIAPGHICEVIEMSDDLDFITLGFKKEYLNDQAFFHTHSEIIHLFSKEVTHKFTLHERDFNEILAVMLALKRKVNMPLTTPYIKDIIGNSFLAVCYEILILFSKNNVFKTVKLNRQEELTSNFVRMLTDSFKTEKRVQYYADSLCVTARYLSQVVKLVTGKTAGELIDEMVIKEAKVLLSNQLFNVSQVANELQFSDQSFFGKFFKKKTGISPSVYRSCSTLAINSPF